MFPTFANFMIWFLTWKVCTIESAQWCWSEFEAAQSHKGLACRLCSQMAVSRVGLGWWIGLWEKLCHIGTRSGKRMSEYGKWNVHSGNPYISNKYTYIAYINILQIDLAKSCIGQCCHVIFKETPQSKLENFKPWVSIATSKYSAKIGLKRKTQLLLNWYPLSDSHFRYLPQFPAFGFLEGRLQHVHFAVPPSRLAILVPWYYRSHSKFIAPFATTKLKNKHIRLMKKNPKQPPFGCIN